MLDENASGMLNRASDENVAASLTATPHDLEAADRRGESGDHPHKISQTALARREPTLDGGALLAPEHDAEKIAFALWRDGRADDAIALLEREILIERDRAWKREAKKRKPREAKRREPRLFDTDPRVIVPPPSPGEAPPAVRRKRRRFPPPPHGAAVTEPAFSDASAPIIDLTAERIAREGGARGDTAPSGSGRVGRGPAIIAAIGLVIVGAAAAANFWDTHRFDRLGHVAPALSVETPAQPAPSVPAASDERKAVTEQAAASPLTVGPAASNAAIGKAAPAAGDGPAEVEVANAELPPSVEPGEPVTASDGPAAVADSASPPDELEDFAGTTAAPAPIVAPRLPRQRPVAAAAIVPPPPSPATIPLPGPADPADAVVADAVPADDVAEIGALHRDQPFTPLARFYGPYGLPARATLTPEEYQALLERRSIAEQLVAERRAAAEDAVPSERRILLRLLRR